MPWWYFWAAAAVRHESACSSQVRARQPVEQAACGEIVSPKRVYGAFDFTGLDERLKELGVDEVVITGQHTHICVRHSSYGALIRGYAITIPREEYLRRLAQAVEMNCAFEDPMKCVAE